MTDISIAKAHDKSWYAVCPKTELLKDAGVCALLKQQQIAIFHLERQQQLFAVSNYDPIGKAMVIYRGILGSVNDEPVIASPLYKQQFALTDGRCLQQEDMQLQTFDVRIENDMVEVLL
ncbi:nitrite reductase small subunit NirD [Thalassotalea sp. HSM 43]|uniref:nitrite reductase small subunit NirD n=1 Tax=Thalassotalea sp. HSM 43 TaxID=2552945 RepID=UPI001080FD54|nr:nitrite reductase small subunit NirD [Thalassotalea sp. HSM 43]QBY05638.1 nitrite reductase small subunit NirD [Thalassotalea sp. HSM 43]